MQRSMRGGVVGVYGVSLGLAVAAGCVSNSGAGPTVTAPDASVSTEGGATNDAGFSSDGRITLEAGQDAGAPDGGVGCTGGGGPGTFTCVGDMGVARVAAGIAPLPGGKALIAGGWNATSTTLTSAEVFDSEAGTFTPTGAMHAPHLWGAWGLGWPTVPTGKPFVAGGLDGTGALLGSAEIYDPTAGTFSLTGPLHTPVLSMFPVVLQDQSVLFIGGWNSTTGAAPTPGWLYNGDGTNEVQRYTPSAGTFADTGPLAEDRLDGCDVLLSTGKVLAIGGYTGQSSTEQNVEQYDPVMGMWATVGMLTTVPTCQQAFVLTSGKVLMVGTGSAANADLLDPEGFMTTATTGFLEGWAPYYVQLQNGDVLAYGGPLDNAATATAMVYRTASNAWQSVGPMGSPRSGAMSATLLTTGDVLIVGGEDDTSPVLKTAELYHP